MAVRVSHQVREAGGLDTGQGVNTTTSVRVKHKSFGTADHFEGLGAGLTQHARFRECSVPFFPEIGVKLLLDILVHLSLGEQLHPPQPTLHLDPEAHSPTGGDSE